MPSKSLNPHPLSVFALVRYLDTTIRNIYKQNALLRPEIASPDAEMILRGTHHIEALQAVRLTFFGQALDTNNILEEEKEGTHYAGKENNKSAEADLERSHSATTPIPVADGESDRFERPTDEAYHSQR